MILYCHVNPTNRAAWNPTIFVMVLSHADIEERRWYCEAVDQSIEGSRIARHVEGWIEHLGRMSEGNEILSVCLE